MPSWAWPPERGWGPVPQPGGQAPFEPEDGAERQRRQWLELRLLLGDRLDDDPQGGRMNPRVGDRLQPFAELRIEIVKIAERAREEEVLADVAVRPLDLALGLGPIGPAGPGVIVMVAGKVDERPVVDDVPLRILPRDRGLHAIVEDLVRHAAERREGGQMTAQHGLQILVQDEAGPQGAAVTQHQGEQPDD